jgi:hypothetical protein
LAEYAGSTTYFVTGAVLKSLPSGALGPGHQSRKGSALSADHLHLGSTARLPDEHELVLPQALSGLFEGRHRGKMAVRVQLPAQNRASSDP